MLGVVAAAPKPGQVRAGLLKLNGRRCAGHAGDVWHEHGLGGTSATASAAQIGEGRTPHAARPTGARTLAVAMVCAAGDPHQRGAALGTEHQAPSTKRIGV